MSFDILSKLEESYYFWGNKVNRLRETRVALRGFGRGSFLGRNFSKDTIL